MSGPTAVEQAYEALLAFVTAAPVGSRLPPERELAGRLGVARSTLRTAVDRLVRLGYLSVKHGAGTVVGRPTATTLALPYRELLAQLPEDRAEALELRRILEPRLAALAARRRSASEAAAITAAAPEGGPDFYLTVANASGNSLASELVRLLVALLVESPSDTPAAQSLTPERAALLRQQRINVAAAIQAGDPSAAREAMSSHLRSAALGSAKKPAANRE